MNRYPHGFAIELSPVQLEQWASGNTGVPYFWQFESGEDGPHVVIQALTHGDEICGALALHRLLSDGIRPRRGKLTFGFGNIAGYRRWNPEKPNAGFFVDEDMNRVWQKLENGTSTTELARAREIRPLIDTADYLLDIHSTQFECPPLFVAGWTAKSRRLAIDLAFPRIVIADFGHKAGTRLRDYSFFADPDDRRTALVVECGQHWRRGTDLVALQAAVRFLEHFGMVEPDALARYERPDMRGPTRVIEVTGTVTVTAEDFAFNRIYTDLEVIKDKGTVLGILDGQPIVTPHDGAVLIMPIRRKIMGVTAVRFGRYVT